MEARDPFFCVKEEVEKTLNSVNSLYSLWKKLRNTDGSGDELHRISDELRNNLKSVEWDLDDLEDTIKIAEKNQKKFNLDPLELDSRRQFITSTKAIVEVSIYRLSNKNLPGFGQRFNYTKLNMDDLESERTIDDTIQRQQMIMKEQDSQLHNIGNSVNSLKMMSSQIGNELDEQAVMLDDFADKMDSTNSKLDNVMKKMSKVLHMSNDRRQWIVIGVLLLTLFIIIILFIVL
ncbi:hypothetical protein HELRODRAFT_67123 [Helobdella robusta]|uniref:t-SNARE coiled-coil homology domain-containing protein n=1 Tax=Helobdella robusta TaxID=6412 RepID=T1FYW7_HELRO|nr:hypothetical protein HELRODRAFT_67123 [Helobdella robusta]ESN98805.1 hypothetical protein HELRODRAFT_67123 [Helobdella robusta]